MSLTSTSVTINKPLEGENSRFDNQDRGIREEGALEGHLYIQLDVLAHICNPRLVYQDEICMTLYKQFCWVNSNIYNSII